MSFNEMLKKLRTNKKLTQEELAQATGLSRSAIGMYEAGSREPSFETLEIFADFFNVDMNTLLDKNQGNSTYCLDPETAKLLRELYDNPNLRSLMDASRKLAPDDVKSIADIVAKMKKKETHDND
ncbi:MAG: helix-turn-helix domain-containing protein [Acidaminococcaceae bacterium]